MANCSQSPQYFTNKFNYNYSYSKIEQWTLSAITFEGGKVEFGTTDREDIESAETGKKGTEAVEYQGE